MHGEPVPSRRRRAVTGYRSPRSEAARRGAAATAALRANRVDSPAAA